MPKHKNSKLIDINRLPGLFMAVLGVIFAAVSSVALAYSFTTNHLRNNNGYILGRSDNRFTISKGKAPSSNIPSDLGRSDKAKMVSDDVFMLDSDDEEEDLDSEFLDSDENEEDEDQTPLSRGPKFDDRRGMSGYYRNEASDAFKGIRKIAETVRSEDFDPETADELQEIVEETTSDFLTTADVLEQEEKRPGWKNLLFGPDYKNLGELRSQQVRNENTLRRLEQVKEKVSDESVEELDQEIARLEQKQEEVNSYLHEREDLFSVFGWFSRLFSGYSSEETVFTIQDEAEEKTSEEEDLIEDYEDLEEIDYSL